MNSTKSDFLALGEAMIELSVTGDNARIGVAGDTFNTAVYVKRSKPNLRVGFATRLGRDPMSARILQAIMDEDIETTNTLSADGNPGLYAISTDPDGERSFQYWRSSSAARRMLAPDGLDLGQLRQTRMLYLSAISLAILPEAACTRLLTWIGEKKTEGLMIAFDSNYRPTLWPNQKHAQVIIEQAWQLCDIGLPSVDDEMALFGDPDEDAVVTRLKAWGVTDGALKRGAAGPRPLDGGAEEAFPQAPHVVDTTAAGDSFNGGYLAARLAGQSSADALRAGHALAGRVIATHGAILPKDSL